MSAKIIDLELYRACKRIQWFIENDPTTLQDIIDADKDNKSIYIVPHDYIRITGPLTFGDD